MRQIFDESDTDQVGVVNDILDKIWPVTPPLYFKIGMDRSWGFFYDSDDFESDSDV